MAEFVKDLTIETLCHHSLVSCRIEQRQHDQMTVHLVGTAPFEVLEAQAEPERSILQPLNDEVSHKQHKRTITTYLDLALHGLCHEKVFGQIGHRFANVVAFEQGEELIFVFLT